MLILSEKAEDLKAGIILLTSLIWHPGLITVSLDSVPRFITLSQTPDKQLAALDITINTWEKFNQTYNTLVD